MFNTLEEEVIIKSEWNILCDANGKLRCNENAFKVLDTTGYSDEEKAVLLSERKDEYLAFMQRLWKERQNVLGEMDTARIMKKWDYEYHIRMKYLPHVIPEWLLSSEDITLFAADICSPVFVENIKKYARKDKGFYLVYYDFIPEHKEETRQSYLKTHPYITESMIDFVSVNWGVWDYPGGEILAWEEFPEHCKITCARRDDWDFDNFQYVSIDFLNCKVIVSEYDFNIATYINGDDTHSFVNLCNCEVTEGTDRRCRFHFLIKDEYGKYNDLILECDDVSIEYNEEYKNCYILCQVVKRDGGKICCK
jgi:hypothetical protein